MSQYTDIKILSWYKNLRIHFCNLTISDIGRMHKLFPLFPSYFPGILAISSLFSNRFLVHRPFTKTYILYWIYQVIKRPTILLNIESFHTVSIKKQAIFAVVCFLSLRSCGENTTFLQHLTKNKERNKKVYKLLDRPESVQHAWKHQE